MGFFKRSNLTGRIMYNHQEIYICDEPIEFKTPEVKIVRKRKIDGVWRNETRQDRIMIERDGETSTEADILLNEMLDEIIE